MCEHAFIYETDLTMTCKSMYYSVSSDKRKADYKACYQQNNEIYIFKQRYIEQNLKVKT